MKYKFKLIFDLEIGYYSNVKVMLESSDYKLNHIGDVSVDYRNMNARLVGHTLYEYDFKTDKQKDTMINHIIQRILDILYVKYQSTTNIYYILYMKYIV